METVIDLFYARPGERFRFRMIGRPKVWYRTFVDDGTHIDHEEEIDGIDSYRAFGSFGIDREDDSLSLIIIPDELGSRLASNFKLLGVNPGKRMGVDVDITVMDTRQRYFIDIGKVSELPNPDIIDRINELWDSGLVEFGDLSEIETHFICDWEPPEWCVTDVDSIDGVTLEIKQENEHDVLVSFLLRSVDVKDEETSSLASRILRIIRINENS